MPKLEREIGKLLRQYEARTGKLPTIGTAESATGGRISDKLTDIPGSSDYYKGSLIAYSNENKHTLLGVKKETIRNFGAVSAQTVVEMAEGGRKLLHVDICLADTGIAGPSGATPEKPVGLFFLGLSTVQETFSREYCFHGTRETNKRNATEAALAMLNEYLVTI